MLRKVDARAVVLTATEGARSATVDAASAAEFKRWSGGRKRAVVLRLFRGEPIDSVSREVGVTIAELEQWRELALAGIEASLKSRTTDPLEVTSIAWASFPWRSKFCGWNVSGRSVAL